MVLQKKLDLHRGGSEREQSFSLGEMVYFPGPLRLCGLLSFCGVVDDLAKSRIMHLEG
jgi:hypothetical protein